MLTRRRTPAQAIAAAFGLGMLPSVSQGALQKVADSPEAFAAMIRWLENEQRQIEWWFNLLATFLGAAIIVLLAAAIIVPVIITRTQRHRLDRHLSEARDLILEVRKAAELRVPSRMTPPYKSALENAPPAFALLEDQRRHPIENAVAQALADPDATPQTRLRAEALHSESQRHWADAQAMWHALRRLNERDGQALYGEAQARKQLVSRYNAPHFQRELQSISALCQKVIEINPRHYQAHGLRARALSELAHATQDNGSAGALFLRADSGFREALKLAPQDVSLHRARANTLRDHARRTFNGEANRGYARAAEAYTEALALAPADLLTLDGLLQAQIERAWMNSAANKPTENLFETMEQHLRAALNDGASKSEILRRQAASVAIRLRFVPAQRARSYFQLARDAVRKVWLEHPEDRDAQLAWALAQFHLGCHSSPGGALRERLFTQAEKSFQRCEQVTPGYAAFHLARIAATRGAPGRARQWIERARDHHHLPPCTVLRAAPDLALVSHSPWYLQLLGELGCIKPLKPRGVRHTGSAPRRQAAPPPVAEQRPRLRRSKPQEPA